MTAALRCAWVYTSLEQCSAVLRLVTGALHLCSCCLVLHHHPVALPTLTPCTMLCANAAWQASAHAVLDKLPDAAQAAAIIDGNRVPLDMRCPTEFIIKGDAKEYR
jgi:hypothetical protein